MGTSKSKLSTATGCSSRSRARKNRPQLWVVELAGCTKLALICFEVKCANRLSLAVRQLLLCQWHCVLVGVVKDAALGVLASSRLCVKLTGLLARPAWKRRPMQRLLAAIVHLVAYHHRWPYHRRGRRRSSTASTARDWSSQVASTNASKRGASVAGDAAVGTVAAAAAAGATATVASAAACAP
jgi:hypothetical protein